MMRKPSPEGATAVVAADSGATLTRVCVADVEGKILGRRVSGPGNAFAIGWGSAANNLADGLTCALGDSGLSPAKIAATVVGSASVDVNGEGSRQILTAIRRVLPQGRARALGDMQIALEGALGGRAGGVIVSGTGSVAFGRDDNGTSVKVGGWGAVMGDEGSAQWIARKALAAAAHAVDGTGPRTQLVSLFTRHFRLRSFHAIIGPVYRDISPRSLGSLAPLVVRAARGGDRVARSVLQKAGEALAEQGAAAIRKLPHGATYVSYQGSVLDPGGTILNPLRRTLKRLEPEVKFVSPLLPPIGGSWLLALRMLDLNPTQAAITHFRRNCQNAFKGRMGKS